MKQFYISPVEKLTDELKEITEKILNKKIKITVEVQGQLPGNELSIGKKFYTYYI